MPWPQDSADDRPVGCPHRLQVDSAHSFIISMQPVPSALQTTLTHVSRSDGRELAFNQTKLINGVYHVTFDEDEAHGIITVNMVTRHPRNNFTAVHNFGNPMLHLKTYEKATTDMFLRGAAVQLYKPHPCGFTKLWHGHYKGGEESGEEGGQESGEANGRRQLVFAQPEAKQSSQLSAEADKFCGFDIFDVTGGEVHLILYTSSSAIFPVLPATFIVAHSSADASPMIVVFVPTSIAPP
ncbi:unnamed protein product [Zymoseptoria tritici ST99CH_3D1]|nr:unnamed protein product [Zymoseptoria tritici ST99CH_3D1]